MTRTNLRDLGLWSRRVVKAAVASALYRWSKVRPGTAWRHQPLVLGYHRVVEDFDEACQDAMPSLLISRAMFERHLQWIGDHFDFISLDQAARHLETGEPFARPSAVITFDDGYRDVFENAWPVLRRLNVPAALFLVSDRINSSQPLVHDRLYSLLCAAYEHWPSPETRLTAVLRAAGLAVNGLGDRGPGGTALLATRTLLLTTTQREMCRILGVLEANVGRPPASALPLAVTWEMVRTMRGEGATIGSHTRTHAWLVKESFDDVDKELSASKAALEAGLGERVDYFAYPDGQFTAATVRAVARAGYRLACTACDHRDHVYPKLTLPRSILWEYSSVGPDRRLVPAVLACQVYGLIPRPVRCIGAHA